MQTKGSHFHSHVIGQSKFTWSHPSAADVSSCREGYRAESSETVPRASQSFWTTISKGHIFSLVSAQEEPLSQRISSAIRAAVQGIKVGPGSKADGGSGPGVRHCGQDRQRPSSTAFTLSQADLLKSLAVQSRAGNRKLTLPLPRVKAHWGVNVQKLRRRTGQHSIK